MKFVGLVDQTTINHITANSEFSSVVTELKFELEVLEIDEVPMFNQDEKWMMVPIASLLYNKITRADGVISLL